MDAAPPIDARRLSWRCRRGMKELDVLLERFVAGHYAALSEDDRRAFVQILDLPDPQLVDYFLADVTPADPRIARIVELIAPRRI